MNYLGTIYTNFFPKPSKKSTSAESMRDASPEQPPIPLKQNEKRNPLTLRRRPYETRARARTMKKYRESFTGPLNTHKMRTRKQTYKIEQFKKTTASKRVAALMQKREIPEARAHFLNSICFDSNVCITLAQNTNMIKHHFNYFTDFTYLFNIKRIGTPSANGFINEFKYEREGYVAHAILKSAIKQRSDNLFYEYLVGQYVNKLNLLYPCFLETYGYFYYDSHDTWKHFKNNKILGADYADELDLQSSKITDESFSNSCTDSQRLCILIQHINEAISLDSKLESKSFLKSHLLYVLYQVYMPLAMNADTFTHYDLHTGNVLLYEPVKGKYIEYHYHLNNNETVTFKCCYIAKIIDYGRSFFVDETNPNKITNTSENIYNKLCKLDACDYTPPSSKTSNSSASMDSESSSNSSNSSASIKSPSKTYSNLMHDTNATSTASDADTTKCGEAYGYALVAPESTPGSFYHISGSKRNMSHDLRLLHILNEEYRRKRIDTELTRLLKTVPYGILQRKPILKVYNDKFGTKEETSSGLPKLINNVIDAHNALKTLVINLEAKASNDAYFERRQKLGDLHIYTDGNKMKFIKTA
jgi:hypothetical protein